MRFSIALLVFTAAVASGSPARSQVEGAPVSLPLWRDLHAGQSPDQVRAILAKYPEIKSVKLKSGNIKKAPSLKISMTDGGIPVFDSAFSLSAEFDLPGRLTSVTLASGDECASGAVEKVDRISQALSEKYGPEKSGRSKLSNSAVSLAILRAGNSGERELISYGYANEAVAVVAVVAFSKVQPPDYPYGGDGLMQALYAIAKAAYDATKSACGNTGEERVAYAIQYMSRAAFDSKTTKIENDEELKRKEARDNL